MDRNWRGNRLPRLPRGLLGLVKVGLFEFLGQFLGQAPMESCVCVNAVYIINFVQTEYFVCSV